MATIQELENSVKYLGQQYYTYNYPKKYNPDRPIDYEKLTLILDYLQPFVKFMKHLHKNNLLNKLFLNETIADTFLYTINEFQNINEALLFSILSYVDFEELISESTDIKFLNKVISDIIDKDESRRLMKQIEEIYKLKHNIDMIETYLNNENSIPENMIEELMNIDNEGIKQTLLGRPEVIKYYSDQLMIAAYQHDIKSVQDILNMHVMLEIEQDVYNEFIGQSTNNDIQIIQLLEASGGMCHNLETLTNAIDTKNLDILISITNENLDEYTIDDIENAINYCGEFDSIAKYLTELLDEKSLEELYNAAINDDIETVKIYSDLILNQSQYNKIVIGGNFEILTILKPNMTYNNITISNAILTGNINIVKLILTPDVYDEFSHLYDIMIEDADENQEILNYIEQLQNNININRLQYEQAYQQLPPFTQEQLQNNINNLQYEQQELYEQPQQQVEIPKVSDGVYRNRALRRAGIYMEQIKPKYDDEDIKYHETLQNELFQKEEEEKEAWLNQRREVSKVSDYSGSLSTGRTVRLPQPTIQTPTQIQSSSQGSVRVTFGNQSQRQPFITRLEAQPQPTPRVNLQPLQDIETTQPVRQIRQLVNL